MPKREKTEAALGIDMQELEQEGPNPTEHEETSVLDESRSKRVRIRNYFNRIFSSRFKRFISYAIYTVILLTLGAICGWIFVNSEQTIAERNKLKPWLKVDILGEEEGRPKNSSREINLSIQTKADDKNQLADRAKEKNKSQIFDNDLMQGIIYPHISEDTENGPLPIIAKDGRQPWIEYSRNFKHSDRKPRVAIIINNLGLSATYTEQILKLMPKNITLSFSHISPKLKKWVREARQKGFEVLIDLPMEPDGFPRNDPGRSTLLTSLSEVENLNRLEYVMVQSGGYVGLLSTHGSKFTINSELLLPILKAIKDRGLLFVDSRTTSQSLGPELSSDIQLPRAFNNVFIDKIPSQEHITTKLRELERIVMDKKFAVAIARPLPISMEILSEWASSLKKKGIALAPITAIADKQSQR
jgi:polysaccharide deacetylase 2 family uncharacterized protein YibQ